MVQAEFFQLSQIKDVVIIEAISMVSKFYDYKIMYDINITITY